MMFECAFCHGNFCPPLKGDSGRCIGNFMGHWSFVLNYPFRVTLDYRLHKIGSIKSMMAIFTCYFLGFLYNFVYYRGKKSILFPFKKSIRFFSEKRKELLLTSKNEIIWLIGLRISERFKMIAKTKQVLKVKFSKIKKGDLKS